MGNYFTPYRRKIGVVTLVMACVFMAGWVRSRHFEEVVDCSYGNTRYAIASVDYRIFFLSQSWLDSNRTWPGFPIGCVCISGGSGSFPATYENGIWKPIDFTSADGCQVDWRRDWIGFHASSGLMSAQGFRFEYRLVPCWSIVVPLTLLSGWLLLSNVRQKPIPVAKPNPEPAV